MTTSGCQSRRMTMSTGKPRICPECKGNGYLRTEMNTIVQCLNCWSEGEIDERFGLGIMILLFLMSCSQHKKIDWQKPTHG